jgi:deazaflavin-dependent oxidoreductase (nitroreductase family)
MLDCRPVTLPRPGTIKAASRLHAFVYRATRGRLGRRLAGHPVLLLTTKGRRTGRPHTTPLLYVRDGGRLVLIASFAGLPRHPDWYLNLAVDPRAEVRLDDERFPATARDADPSERNRLWGLAVAEYPGYAGYQERTERLIPVVVLQRD